MVFTLNGRFVLETCCTCGIAFALPEEYQEKKMENHTNFYCPNGHAQHYGGKTEAEKLKDKLAAEESRHAQTRADRDREQKLRRQAERSARAQRGQVTKIKNRIWRGVCPCCNRTFVDLQKHMMSKHPEFIHDGAETSDA